MTEPKGDPSTGAPPVRAWWRYGGLAAVVTAVVLAGAAFALRGGSDAAPAQLSAADPIAELAARLSDSAIVVYPSSTHTIYHATAALPSVERPRADGRSTLIWFSQPT